MNDGQLNADALLEVLTGVMKVRRPRFVRFCSWYGTGGAMPKESRVAIDIRDESYVVTHIDGSEEYVVKGIIAEGDRKGARYFDQNISLLYPGSASVLGGLGDDWKVLRAGGSDSNPLIVVLKLHHLRDRSRIRILEFDRALGIFTGMDEFIDRGSVTYIRYRDVELNTGASEPAEKLNLRKL